MRAKSVKSEPVPTLRPAWKLEPTCRTRMLPAETSSPPKIFTPRYCAFEPRPLRVAPAPFLCAMASSGLHGGDVELRVRLTVPVLAAVVLPAPELEDDDLLVPILRRDRRRDLRAHDEVLFVGGE